MSDKSKNRNEVILSPYTCSSVVNAIIYANLIPVFIEIARYGVEISLSSLKSALSDKTLCVIFAYIYGVRFLIEKIVSPIHNHGALLVEDCAHCMPNIDAPHWRHVISDVAIYSFGPTKPMGGRHGSIVICNNELEEIALLAEVRLSEPEYRWVARCVFSYIAGYLESLLQGIGLSAKSIRKYLRSRKWWVYHPGDYEKQKPEVYPVYMTKGEAALTKHSLLTHNKKYQIGCDRSIRLMSVIPDDYIMIRNHSGPLLCLPIKDSRNRDTLVKCAKQIYRITGLVLALPVWWK
ncbi:MAG: DegT/DnrJ/EryC1/StrS family aminotransferase [Candidatus Thiodiazotropha endolucinida]|nr:DegT/DnrJ/EryC1/StrS family aminotransferase [Candidatus Thiodiazotropha taylori]